MRDDFTILPKVKDSWSYLYVEHCQIKQDHKAIAIYDKTGKTPVPCANLLVLLLGPGTSITHAAVMALADAGCLVIWCGEEGVRFYAEGLGETQKAKNILHQATVWADEKLRLAVVKRLYQMRFAEALPEECSLQQIRGMEGVRIQEAYRRFSAETGVPWRGRQYHRDNWVHTNAINKALSVGHMCLYGVCHAAIVSGGFSPAIGFIHTGKMASFVFDIADLYKTETTIPAAFTAVSFGAYNLEADVRHVCRDFFKNTRLLQRIIPDIQYALGLKKERVLETLSEVTMSLWDPETGGVACGKDYSKEMVIFDLDSEE